MSEPKHIPRHRRRSANVTGPAGSELLRHGPNATEARIRLQAEAVEAELAEQRDKWRFGFTRRRVIAGAGAVGVAALGSQLVTAKVSFAAAPDGNTNTLVVVFLRGGQDGLSVLVPADDPDLRRLRPNIGIPASTLVPVGRGFGLHPEFAPLKPFWDAGRMAAVHAVASPDASRSHFQAQDCLERGSKATTVRTGWLDRALTGMGPGTTFRAVAEGSSTPRSLLGVEPKLVLSGIEGFTLAQSGRMRDRSIAALQTLYTGFDHPVADQAQQTVQALAKARKIANMAYRPAEGANYPGGGFADQLRDVARLIKADIGLRVSTIDLGGWDMHTNLGRVDGGDMRNSLNYLAGSLTAFATDLGPRLDKVNLVLMTEFGRRVAENGNVGVDHGHGSLALLLGGGLRPGVHGRWPGLNEAALDQGDLAGVNDYRDLLGEILTTRMGVGDVKKVFPDHEFTRIGVTV